jgi:hypothetical protein
MALAAKGEESCVNPPFFRALLGLGYPANGLFIFFVVMFFGS